MQDSADYLEYSEFMIHDKFLFCFRYLVVIIHVALCGVLWRYLKLFVPVDVRYVKHEVRDLCVLRLIHAFCEAAPLLLIQLYLLFKVCCKYFLSCFLFS